MSDGRAAMVSSQAMSLRATKALKRSPWPADGTVRNVTLPAYYRVERLLGVTVPE
jgi:hypothetical protein